MRTMHITLIAGARPNFMKIAPLIKAIKEWKPTSGNVLRTATGSPIEQSSSPIKGREEIQYRLVHTGQHYDKNMSDTFFEELGIPAPDVNLGCGGGTQAGRALGHILKRIIVEDKRTFTTEIRNQVRHYQWQPNEEDDQVMHVPVWVRGES